MPFKAGMKHIFNPEQAIKANSPWFVRPFEALGEGGGSTSMRRLQSGRQARKSIRAQHEADLAEISRDSADLARMNPNGRLTDDQITALGNRRMDAATRQTTALNEQGGTNVDFIGDVGSALWAGDWRQKAVKAGVLGAGWMGLNGAGRLVSGGSATTNNAGQRDIMGVPLI